MKVHRDPIVIPHDDTSIQATFGFRLAWLEATTDAVRETLTNKCEASSFKKVKEALRVQMRERAVPV